MPSTSDDLEKYLKQFRPVPAEELWGQRAVQSRPKFGRWSRWGLAFTGAALLITVILHFNSQDRSVKHPPSTRMRISFPLTVDRANAELFAERSPKQALDRLAFPISAPLPQGQQSALNVLGREQTKL